MLFLLSKWFHQDGCRSAVALLLKAALIQVSDYRLLGAFDLLLLLSKACPDHNFLSFEIGQ
jgi:hypothetical protein